MVSVPIATGAVKQVFGELDPMYEDVGLTLDLSRWGVFMKVIVPMTYRELLSSFMIAWNRVVSEFGSIVCGEFTTVQLRLPITSTHMVYLRGLRITHGAWLRIGLLYNLDCDAGPSGNNR